MSVASIKSEIGNVQASIIQKSREINEIKDKIKEIEDAMSDVNTLWTNVNAADCKNTFNYVKRNCGLPIVDDNGNVTNSDSKNFWVVQDDAGNACGDIASFSNALDGVVAQIDNVSVSMEDVMSKAQEKLEEYQTKLSALEAEVASLQSELSSLNSQLEAAEENADEISGIKNDSNVDLEY